jgi:hypothetical protein
MAPAAWAGAGLIRVLGATWRVDASGLADYDRRVAAGERCIFAFWHARLLALAYTHRHRGAVVLVSQHRDGELIARAVGHLGFRLARGSSTRGGDQAMRELLRAAEEGALIAVTPDGPRGPRERVKPGLVALASRSGRPIVPVAAASHPAWVLRSWDRFRVPKPFARVVVAYGEPIAIPPALSEEETERWRAVVEEALARHTAVFAARAGEAA